MGAFNVLYGFPWRGLCRFHAPKTANPTNPGGEMRMSMWTRTPGAVWTLAMIGVLVLVLQIPVALIRDVIRDRQATRDQAYEAVVAASGGSQSIIGPVLVVPYRSRPFEEESSGEGPSREPEGSEVAISPDFLEIQAAIEGDRVRRGIFAVPIYRSEILLTGSFSAPETTPLGLPSGALDWSAARIVVELTDPRSIGLNSEFRWLGEPIPIHPGLGGRSLDKPGIHAPVGASDPVKGEFSIRLPIGGSGSLHFAPVARETRARLESDWPDPSFSGSWRPHSQTVSPDGFKAEWSIPFLGRGLPLAWDVGSPPAALGKSLFGVDLITVVDHYRMSERSTKYSVLFITLTFGVFWLFEVLLGIGLHPVQYLLVGAGLCLFFLLELALSEHVGFLAAYVMATLGIVGLVSAYCRAVLGTTIRAMIVGMALACLYLYLFVLLRLEEFALLVGSIGLFVVLAAAMYLTRWISWPSLRPEGDQKPESE